MSLSATTKKQIKQFAATNNWKRQQNSNSMVLPMHRLALYISELCEKIAGWINAKNSYY